MHFTPEEDAYSARRFLINAYCGQDQYFAAMREVLSSLVEYPIDFGVLALYEQLKETILQNDPESTAVLLEEESTLQALKSTSSGGSGAGDDAVVSAKHAYDLILAHSSSAYPTPAPKVVRQDPAVPLTYNSFNSYVRSRTPVFIPSTPTIADTTVTAAAAAASDVALSTSSSETSADLLRFLDKLNDCGYLYANGDEHMELSVEISHRRGHTSASADTVATAATAGEDVVEHVGYGLSTLRTFVNYYDFLDQVYCAHYHGDHKPVSDGKPRANIMAGQHVIDTNKYNYYVTTQVRENVAAYYKLKNERYVGAYFDQQPVFMQYVIDAAKARKKFKDQLIYVDHLSVEEVAERMQAYQMEVDKKESERKSEYSHLYNVPLTSFLKDVEGVVPSILYQRNAVATANSTTVDVNVDGDSSGNIINRNENDIRNENASNSEDGDEEEHLYDIWGNMTDINLWMGVNGNINSNIIINSSSSSDSSIRAVTNTVTTKTRLHMDPHDNLYTLVTGRKKFMLIAPSYAPLLKTIYPTFAIGKNGMSFRTGGNIAIPWENKQQQENQESKQSDEFVSLVPPVLFSSDTASSHFSRLLPHQVESYCVEHNISFEIVELTQPGDRLFIPAGWFHQVTSYGKLC